MPFNNKPFVYCVSKDVFNTLKRSTSVANDAYVIGDSTTVTQGTPEILWKQICFIEDTNEIYTYGEYYTPTTIKQVDMTSTSATLEPNKFYIWGEVASLDITFATPTDTSIYNEYMFQFVSGSTATTISLPSSIKWATDTKINANETYQVSVVNNIGVIIGVSNS